MALTNYQYSYRGVIFGDSTNYDIIEMNGLHDMIVKDSDRDNPRSHGTIPGRHSATFHLIRCSMEVRGTAGSTGHEDDIQAILSAMSPDAHQDPSETDDQFVFQFPGEDEKFFFCRPVRRSRPRRNASEFGLATVRFELKTYDPRSYSTTEDNSGTQTTTWNVTNGGDAFAYPILDFDPTAGGAVELNNNTNGDQFKITTGAGSGAALIADMGRFIRGRGDLLIVYRGSTNHYGLWDSPRNPFRLSPGVNSLTLTTGDSVVIKSRDTWM